MRRNEQQATHIVSPTISRGDWAVRRYGSMRARALFVAKASAITYAKEVSPKWVYVIGLNGTVQARWLKVDARWRKQS